MASYRARDTRFKLLLLFINFSGILIYVDSIRKNVTKMPYTLKNWKERIASRSDLTGHLIHLTRGANINSQEVSSLDILIKILLEQR